MSNILGALPAQYFTVTVSSTAESLAQLMYSVLLTGYLFRNAYYRMQLRNALLAGESVNTGMATSWSCPRRCQLLLTEQGTSAGCGPNPGRLKSVMRRCQRSKACGGACLRGSDLAGCTGRRRLRPWHTKASCGGRGVAMAFGRRHSREDTSVTVY